MSDAIINTAADRTQPISSGIRIAGFDIARGIALFIMIVLNFKNLFTVSNHLSGDMDTLFSFFDRRAAAVLVMIAGIGMN